MRPNFKRLLGEMALNSLSAGFIVPGFAALASAANHVKDCYGKTCSSEEYCSIFSEGCAKCADICDANTHNYQADLCAKECAAFRELDPLKAEIKSIHNQQNTILILLVILLVLIAIRYTWKFCRWLRNKHCITHFLRKLRPRKHEPANIKDINGIGATTIQNVMTINDVERAPSQIYSVTAGAEGSVMTMTTPVSTRYPAENSTPTNVPTEYSYDNQALAVTPVSEKPNCTNAF